MVLLSLVFVIIVALQELTDLPEAVNSGLDAVAWLIWGAFACELLIKAYLVPNRRQYLRTHWADVLTVALPVLRPFRLLRVVAAGTRSWQNTTELLRHHAFSLLGVTSLSAVIVAAILVFAAERQRDGPIQSFADALWWAAATITTVGYGDVYPKTPAGRGVAVALMLVGISLFGLLTARVAAFFVQGAQDEPIETKLEEILARIDQLDAANVPAVPATKQRQLSIRMDDPSAPSTAAQPMSSGRSGGPRSRRRSRVHRTVIETGGAGPHSPLDRTANQPGQSRTKPVGRFIRQT